jgi:hypothetical protein
LPVSRFPRNGANGTAASCPLSTRPGMSDTARQRGAGAAAAMPPAPRARWPRRVTPRTT